MSPPAPTQGDGFCASRSSGPNTTTYRSSTDSPWRSAGTSGKRARNSSTVIGPGTARARSSRSRERRICTIGSLPARLYPRRATPRAEAERGDSSTAPTRGRATRFRRRSAGRASRHRSQRGITGRDAPGRASPPPPPIARRSDDGTRGEGPVFTRSGARLELDHVAVGVAEIDRGAVAPRAVALNDVALEGDGLRAQRLGDRLEIVAPDREAEVIGPDRPRLRGGQQVDHCLAAPQVDQRDPLAQLVERAAQHVLVEPA